MEKEPKEMICWMAGERGRQEMERVTQQTGEEENPYFSKVEVATRAVLWSELGFQEISWKRGSFQSFLAQACKISRIFGGLRSSVLARRDTPA